MGAIIPNTHSLCPFKTLKLTKFLHLNAIDQQLQIGRCQSSLALERGAYPELTLLQTFGPQTIAGRGKVQHFHLRFASVDKHKILATERIMLELIAHQRTQAPERFAHIGRFGAQPDPRLAIQSNHPLWLSRSSTPLPRLSTIFHPGPDDVALPIKADRSRKSAFSALGRLLSLSD